MKLKNISANKGTVRLASLRNKANIAGKMIKPGTIADLSAEFSEQEIKKASVEILGCVKKGWLEEVQ